METYWISGAQIGVLIALATSTIDDNSEQINKLLEEIVECQQVSNDVRKTKSDGRKR